MAIKTDHVRFKALELREVSNKIEELRQELVRLFKIKGGIDREVLAVSKRLDVLINNYYKMLS